MSWNTAEMPPSTQDVLARLQRERDVYAGTLAEMTARYEQKIQELSLLRRTSESLGDCTDLDEVFRRLLHIVLEELATSAASLYLAEDSGALVLRAYGPVAGLVCIVHPADPGGLRIEPGAGPLGLAFRRGEILIEHNVPAGSPGWFPEDARALLTAPLGPDGGCIGVLALHDRRLDDVPEDAPRLLPILASQATIAIENAALCQRLKQHSDSLEAKVRERTAALEHLNAELQAAARHKSQFFAHFSHELRTPLNSILGFSELLLAQMHGPLTEAQLRHVGHIRQSGERLLGLINDILDLVKVEAGRLRLQVEPQAVAAAVEQAMAVMHPQAAAKHLHLEQATPLGICRVAADPARLHQILLNLLSNAIKFTPEGGTVTVRARAVGAESGADQPPETADQRSGEEGVPLPRSTVSRREFVEISVTDTGPGIALEDQARLFQDFEQVANGKGQGTGLGLSLTRRLVALHEGRVGLRSSPGAGSTFWFTLPAVAREGGADHA